MQESQRVSDALDLSHVGDPFAAAIRATRMAMIVTNARQPDNPIVFVNDSFLRLTGYDRDEIFGRNCRFLQGPDTDPATIDELRDAIAQDRDVAVDILNYRKDGTPFWNALYLSPVHDEHGQLTYFFGSQMDVTDRKQAEAELRAIRDDLEGVVAQRTDALGREVEQKTALLHEVDHRVKNNLQLISSLIQLQSRRTADPVVKQTLQSVLERVTAISTVHRRLYQSNDVERFDVAQFMRDLVGAHEGASGRDDVRYQFDLQPAAVPATKAAPLALVVNELLVNAERHAFPPGGGGGVITVRSVRCNDHVAVEVEDDGRGRASQADGFGLTIVGLLAKQLKAQVEQHAGPGGGVRTRVVLRDEGA